MFHGQLDYFEKSHLGGRPNTKPGDHDIPNAHNCWFIQFYHVWGPAWMEIHSNSICLRVQSHMTSHYTWGSATTLHDFGGLGWPLDTFLGGSHNFIVTTLGSCVNWPLSWGNYNDIKCDNNYIVYGIYCMHIISGTHPSQQYSVAQSTHHQTFK